MNTDFSQTIKIFFLLLCCLSFTTSSSAHNGSIAFAYPVDQIKIDGDISDWAQVKNKYPFVTELSDMKAENAEDCSAYFKVGYQPSSQCLYILVEVIDDDYFRDTTKKVAWNTQDALELDLDIRHLPMGSGIVNYLYSSDYKNISKSLWDTEAKKMNWDNTEVAMKRLGNKIIYEWKISLAGQLTPGKSLGLDFQVFDKDNNGSFTYISWGKEGYKFRNPNSLGDVIIMKAPEPMSIITGMVHVDSENKGTMPNRIQLTSTAVKNLWVKTTVDSNGWYSVSLPNGIYQLSIPEAYKVENKKIYSTSAKPVTVKSNKGVKTEAPVFNVSNKQEPDLLPAEGLLQNFDKNKAKQLDAFIETYQKYYQVPGVSLALIKDGKVVYHQTYGVKNIITQAKVEESTMFEAASVTKPVFAFAVQRLMEKGMIDLDKPLYEYLPNPDIEYDPRYKKMTARHVLTHRTGFPNWRYMNPDGKLDLKFEPGTKYNYSGEGFEYLKKVVEKITGKKVEQVLQEEVINPLGLYHFYFSKNDTLEKLVSTGHYDNIPSNDGLPTEPGMAYSLYTEAVAFTRFMLALLNQEGLSKTTFDNMLKV
ncbi:MAG: serine hydrolase, partial [Saprospiraceae bacterium]